jgi:hypothetical protein
MDEILEDIKKIESEQIDYHKLSDDYFGVNEGKIPILISAPHGARHLRFSQKDGSLWKEEDEYTASMAIKLGELTGAHVIYVKNKTIEDPNFEEVSKYKFAIKQIVEKEQIKFLADIHGADKNNTFNIDVGIIDEKDMKQCSCPKLKPVIERSLIKFQNPLFNQKFNASHLGTITYFARHVCGIESAQFEINAKYRIIERKSDASKAIKGVEPDYKADRKDVMAMFNHLKEMILNIKEKVETR